MSTAIQKVNGSIQEQGVMVRENFGGNEMVKSAETAVASVQARETARINAMYVMSERHPRDWDTVRVRLMKHCDRPGFAEVAKYKKPTGKKQINGQWVDTFAEGLSARFAEVARQEMANTNTETAVVYDDAALRIIRASVVDLERNTIESREIAIQKITEKRGKRTRAGEWEPPEGREVLSERLNTYGDPVYICRATDDEIQNKQNSLISKATRDASLRLIPKDIRDDCYRRVIETINDPNKTDPAEAKKRIIDSFAGIGVIPHDLVSYIGTALDKISPAELDELRGLFAAINSGECSFNEAMQKKLDNSTDGEPETTEQRDLRLQRQMDEQHKAAQAEATKVPRGKKPPAATEVKAETVPQRSLGESMSVGNFKTAIAGFIDKDPKLVFDVFKRCGLISLQDVPGTDQGRMDLILAIEEALKF